MSLLSESHHNVIAAAIHNCKNGAKRALDPANPADAAAIKAFLELSGKTEKSHPGLYADLEHLAKSPSVGAVDHDQQVLDIVDSGRDAHGRATARVWHLDRGGTHVASSLAMVQCAKTGKTLALGHANKVGGGLCPAATRSASAQQAPDQITTVGFYHAQSSPTAMPQFGMVTKTETLATMDGVDATVTAPVISVAGHTSIVIGLGRPNPNTDLDYYYRQDTNDNPPLLVPFTGTVNVGQPLANLDQNGHFTSGLGLTTQLYSVSAAQRVDHNSSQSLTSQVVGNASTNVVTWSYPFDPNHTSPTDTPSLIYGTQMAARDTTSAFFFQFQIPVQNIVNPYFTFNVCSYAWPDQPSTNCVQIPNLQFYWHCLAKGTRVTLADGSTREIEHVDNTVRVRTGSSGGTLAVEATTRGQHRPSDGTTGPHGIYELTTGKGRTLVLTGGHPVATDSGLVLACDLEPGTVLHSEDGTDRVARCEPTRFDGMFANLKLIDEHDRARGLAGTVGTFIANGIVVGDFLAMTRAHYNNTHSLEYMKARIPERYHADYASTLSDISRDNIRYGAQF